MHPLSDYVVVEAMLAVMKRGRRSRTDLTSGGFIIDQGGMDRGIHASNKQTNIPSARRKDDVGRKGREGEGEGEGEGKIERRK